MRVVSNIGKLYTLFGWHQFAICGYRGQCSRLMVDGDEIQPHSLKEVSYLERIIIMIFCCGSLHQRERERERERERRDGSVCVCV